MAAFGGACLIELHHTNWTLEGLEHFYKLETRRIGWSASAGQASKKGDLVLRLIPGQISWTRTAQTPS